MAPQEKLSMNKLGDLFLVLGLMLAGLLIWKLPEWLVPASANMPLSAQLTMVNETRTTIALICVGLLLASGFVLLFRRLSWLENYFADSRESQVTDRFSRAIEQLGTYKVEVQLGGIFSLERIARESEKEHWTIMEVLTAYVRENAQFTPKQHTEEAEEEIRDPVKSMKAATDIQAIMTVIGRRGWTDRELEQGKILNLRKSNLEFVDLRGANLRFANLRGVNLEGANLMEADLTGAFLGEANLRNANLAKANLTGATFIGANLRSANLKGCILENTGFLRANLKGAQLSEAVLEMADFTAANLEAADICGVSLNRANLNNARLKKLRYDYGTNFPDWLSEEKRDELNMEFNPG